jgi:hypothetical protein
MSLQLNETTQFWKLLVLGHARDVTCEEFENQITSALLARKINSYESSELTIRHTRLCWNKEPADRMND